MKNGYKVEYSEDEKQIRIIPYFFIPYKDLMDLIYFYSEKGYKYWVPSQHERGYILSKFSDAETIDIK